MSFTRLALAAPVAPALAFATVHGLHAPANSVPDAAPAVDDVNPWLSASASRRVAMHGITWPIVR